MCEEDFLGFIGGMRKGVCFFSFFFFFWRVFSKKGKFENIVNVLSESGLGSRARARDSLISALSGYTSASHMECLAGSSVNIRVSRMLTKFSLDFYINRKNFVSYNFFLVKLFQYMLCLKLKKLSRKLINFRINNMIYM